MAVTRKPPTRTAFSLLETNEPFLNAPKWPTEYNNSPTQKGYGQ